jgi:hypothetical protein
MSNTPGFVDVSNMTSQEVKRLGQMDDYDDPRDNAYSYRNLAKRNPYAYRKPMTKTPKVTISYNADDVWSAACAAQRINGAYVKNIAEVAEGQKAETNRQIVERFLSDTSLITQADRDQAENVRKYYKGFTFKILQGKKLNEFDNNAMVIANRDVITTNYDIAVIASLPSCYERSVKRDNMNRKLESATGGFIGRVGDKVQVSVEVVRSVYSQQWNVFFVSGVTSDDQAVFFSYKQQLLAGSLIVAQGTVKAHRDNCTQLNRVKVK